ncbi:ABC transporter permease [Bacillus sp. DJP31]|uniref:ABC transporter permease n=1 Tax=Bacillus sp. DJP31 TaxID=3409789 RepID=UPI003BB66CBD
MYINNIWKQRFADHIKELSGYLRYMFNDHLMIVLLIAISAGAVYYKQWLSQLPVSFPFEWVMAIILGLVITSSPIKSFLKEPDLVFLLPVEHKLALFFRNGIVYSFVLQSFLLLSTFIALVPMYVEFTKSSVYRLLVVLFVLIILKLWNMALSWMMHYFIDRNSRVMDTVMRFVFNIVFIALFLKSAPFLLMLILLIIAVLWLVSFLVITKEKSVKWEILLQAETRQMNRFYRLANLFVDVPHLRSEVKPRRWLDWISASIPLQKDRLYEFLYLKTFIRSGEYLGLYVRLLVIAGFIVMGINLKYSAFILIPFFIYLSGLQLLALYKQHDNKLWLDLYPVSITNRQQAFLALLLKLMIGKGIVLSVILLWENGFLDAILGALVSSLFSYLFVQFYLKNKLLKASSN